MLASWREALPPALCMILNFLDIGAKPSESMLKIATVVGSSLLHDADQSFPDPRLWEQSARSSIS